MAALVGVLVLVDAVLSYSNTQRQAQANERQVYIQQSLQLEGLYKQLVNSLAELSAQYDDGRIEALLAAQGITFAVKQRTPDPAGPRAAVPPKGN